MIVSHFMKSHNIQKPCPTSRTKPLCTAGGWFCIVHGGCILGEPPDSREVHMLQFRHRLDIVHRLEDNAAPVIRIGGTVGLCIGLQKTTHRNSSGTWRLLNR